MDGIIGTSKLTQVALIVRDIEKTKTRLAEFLGVPVPPHFGGGDYAVTQTQYMGAPAPDASCMMAFFTVGDGVQIELIQPNGVASVWQDFLNQKGEGLHHIAFNVKGMDSIILSCEGFGMKLVQKGNYGSGDGCYSYLEGGNGLPFILELLESF
ncbi:MAG: VOC family protein [Oscillospiraceae bacterium]|jgi:catechol 2,3-dioxygenase-like lactoylglutathione lyase family enzyme|nr:VOC family protein [Oscillospiraceae bacterium]